MAEDSWAEGRRAWSRLSEWIQLDGDALQALEDVGLVRRLLDRAEFEAVRNARREGRSWSEIAVRLGVTRQSAWERWRDLDDDAVVEDAATALSDRAKERRRRSSAEVPNVVGLSWTDARRLLRVNRLLGEDADPDSPPLVTDVRPGMVVVDQSPEAGARVPPGSTVKLWVKRGGGGSGVREPRRPMPDPLPGAKHLDEVTDEAV